MRFAMSISRKPFFSYEFRQVMIDSLESYYLKFFGPETEERHGCTHIYLEVLSFKNLIT